MTAELPEAIVAGVKGTIPAGRFGKPEEVAGLVKYLALDGAPAGAASPAKAAWPAGAAA